MVIELTKEHGSSGPSLSVFVSPWASVPQRERLLSDPSTFSTRGELAKQNAPWLEKKRLEIANSHFPLTCLKCDNCVSGVSFARHKDEKWSWGGGQKTQCLPFLPLETERAAWLAGGPICSHKECNDLEKSSTFFFFIAKKEWEENANSCS